MNILHLRASPFLGSPERLLLNQIRHMGGRPFNYIVGVFNEQPTGKNDFIEALEQIEAKGYVLHENIFLVVPTLIRLRRLVRLEKIDLICAHDYKSDFFALFVGALGGPPCVAVFHGRTSQGVKLRLFEKLDDYLLRFFRRVIAVSNDIKVKLGRIGIEEDKIKVIANGIDVISSPAMTNGTSAPPDIGVSDGAPMILYAGRLSKEKGVHVLISALPEVLSCKPNAKIVVLGEGPEGVSLRSQVESLGLAQHVLFLGFRKDIQPFLRAMDLCVLPSFTEGMPLIILEAFANAKPVLASRVGGIPDLVHDGVTGMLVEAGNPGDLARGIIKLLEDSDLAKGMGKAGWELVRTQYSVERQVEAYCRLFIEVFQEAR